MHYHTELPDSETLNQRTVRSDTVNVLNDLASMWKMLDMELNPGVQNTTRTVEEEFREYVDGHNLGGDLNPLTFWEVHFPTCDDCTLAYISLPEKEDDVPNHIPDGDGLSTNPGFCGPL